MEAISGINLFPYRLAVEESAMQFSTGTFPAGMVRASSRNGRAIIPVVCFIITGGIDDDGRMAFKAKS